MSARLPKIHVDLHEQELQEAFGERGRLLDPRVWDQLAEPKRLWVIKPSKGKPSGGPLENIHPDKLQARIEVWEKEAKNKETSTGWGDDRGLFNKKPDTPLTEPEKARIEILMVRLFELEELEGKIRVVRSKPLSQDGKDFIDAFERTIRSARDDIFYELSRRKEYSGNPVRYEFPALGDPQISKYLKLVEPILQERLEEEQRILRDRVVAAVAVDAKKSPQQPPASRPSVAASDDAIKPLTELNTKIEKLIKDAKGGPINTDSKKELLRQYSKLLQSEVAQSHLGHLKGMQKKILKLVPEAKDISQNADGLWHWQPVAAGAGAGGGGAGVKTVESVLENLQALPLPQAPIPTGSVAAVGMYAQPQTPPKSGEESEPPKKDQATPEGGEGMGGPGGGTG